MTPLILIIGELGPKSIGWSRADTVAFFVAPILRRLGFILYPFVLISSFAADTVSRLLAKHKVAEAKITREDVRIIAELAGEEGMLEENTVSMIKKVFELGIRPVSSVMKPLSEVISLPDSATVKDVRNQVVESGYTRFPVYHENVNNIVGIIDLRHILYGEKVSLDTSSDATPITDFIQRNVLFVSGSQPVDSLLHELHYHRIPMAVVTGQDDNVIGIVTTEDLVEEVVGEIIDERDM